MEGALDKFLYGDEFSHLDSKAASGEKINSEIEGDFDEVQEEEEEDDYEIILDSSKLLANPQLSASTNDINKRSLTSVAIGDEKGNETGGSEFSDQKNSTPTVPVSHFDPFAPGNLNGLQIFDHDLDNFEDKPWRKPGADLTDYFNFGFNETTWRAYCVKQKALREEFGLQKKIGVYDSSSMGVSSGSAINGGGSAYNNQNNYSASTVNSNTSGYRPPYRRPPGHQNVNQQSGYQSGSQSGQQGGYQHQHQSGSQSGQQGGYQHQHQSGQQGSSQSSYQNQHQNSYQSHHQSSYQSIHQNPHQNAYRSNDQVPPPPPSNYSRDRDYSNGGHVHSNQPGRPRSHHDSPPPPPRHVSSHDRSASRSRSPDSTQRTRYVSSGPRQRYDDAPRSPPNKRRRD